MLTKNYTKLIKSLKQKNKRKDSKRFVVEGIKSINEFIQGDFEIERVYLLESAKDLLDLQDTNFSFVNEKELQSISFLKTAQKALALVHIPEKIDFTENSGLTLALDDVKDPGNLGTIIRLADWFGIETVLCSSETVDVYNPKVVQATMGSLNRVKVIYLDLKNFLDTYTGDIYGAFMNGDNIYKSDLKTQGILVMGNEANGISPEIEAKITRKITIPQFGKGQTESLNVAMATSILLSEFKSSEF